MSNATKTNIARPPKSMDYLIMASMFLYSIVFFKSPVEFYASYLPMVLLLPIFIIRYGIPQIPIKVFAPLLIMGVIYILLGDNTIQQFIKIFLGLLMSVLFFNYIFIQYNFDVKYLYRVYLKAAYIIAIIGIVQIVAFQLGITPLYNFKWIFNKWGVNAGGLGIRINSILSEPAYVAASLAPAFFVAVNNLTIKEPLFISRKKSMIIILAYLLSFSSLAILAAFLTIILILWKNGLITTIILIVPITLLGFYIAYNNVDEFKDRFDSTLQVFSGEGFNSYSVHGSSFVLYNNYHVASENFKRNPLFGTGLGSHSTAFDKYTLTNQIGVIDIAFNSADANSMFLRIMSETGLFGILFILIFLVRNFSIYKLAYDQEFWVISMGCFIIIVIYLIRQGHYFYNGFPFFIWMYYYAAKQSRLLRSQDTSEENDDS